MNLVRGVRGSLVAVIVAASVGGCAPAPGPDVAPSTRPTVASGVTFTSVVDGDTIETSAGTVRIIGIDAPERGVCGYAEASTLVSSLLLPGDRIVLVLPEGQNPQDTYGRMLRYVDTAEGVDVAASLLTAGLAVARYDSTDGYPAHPRESDYRAAQVATIAGDGSVMTPACQATTTGG